MAFTASATVLASVEQVVETFSDEAFVRHVAEQAGGGRVPGGAQRHQGCVRQCLPRAAPNQMLRPEGEQTDGSVEGTVVVSIPFAGKKIAATAEPYVGKTLSVQP